MATSIPAGAPRGPQHRKQIADAEGNYHPVADEQQPGEPAPIAPAIHPFEIGDAVTLTGRVLEVQSPQGGQMSVKVQTPQGVAWFGGQHIQPATKAVKVADPRVAELEADAERAKDRHEKHVAELKADIDEHKNARSQAANRIAELEKELAEAKKPSVPTSTSWPNR